jgi:hypothetical protein
MDAFRMTQGSALNVRGKERTSDRVGARGATFSRTKPEKLGQTESFRTLRQRHLLSIQRALQFAAHREEFGFSSGVKFWTIQIPKFPVGRRAGWEGRWFRCPG